MGEISKTQAGFTLIEITIAIALLSVLAFSVVGSFMPLLQAKTEYATNERLAKVALAVTAAYRVNAVPQHFIKS